MSQEKVNPAEKLSFIDERWNPKIVGELNVFEPASTSNTGRVRNWSTREELERI